MNLPHDLHLKTPPSPAFVAQPFLMKQILSAVLTAALVSPALAQTAATTDDDKAQAAELAKKLQNPVAALISVPIQNNFDFGGGPNDDGFQYKLTLQPVSFTLGVRYYADKPSGGSDWGLRFAVTLLFPR